MDPVTAALNMINTICELTKLTIESLPPEERAAYAKLQLDRLQKWYEFVDKVTGIFHKQPAA